MSRLLILGATGTRVLKANIRVIAATNRHLRKAVEGRDFREDLFYRLGVFDIRTPALRDRPSDILPLSETFPQEIGRSFGRPPVALTREARTVLVQDDWPGNVRELRNALERAAIVCEGALIDASHLNLQPGARQFREDTTDLGVLRTNHDCQGPARLPRQQDEGGTATGIVAHTAALADSEVPTRGSGHRVIAIAAFCDCLTCPPASPGQPVTYAVAPPASGLVR